MFEKATVAINIVVVVIVVVVVVVVVEGPLPDREGKS